MPGSVAVVGLGRVGLPLALSFADRGLHVIGVERERTIIDAVAERPDAVPARPARRSCSSGCSSPGASSSPSAVADAARADHIVLTLGTPAYEHVEIDVSQIRDVIDDLLPVLREGHSVVLRSTVAPGTTEWVAGYLEQRRGLRPARRCSSRTCRSGSRPTASSRRSHTLPCIVGGVGEESGARAAELFEVVRHRDRADHARAGRAREDLDQHPALHAVRAAQPPDDGVRAVRGERVRRDRPDQPRLPARRDRGPGAHGRRLPAQGLRLLGGALERARDAAGRVAGPRDRAAVPREGAASRGSAARCATARSPCWG